MSEKNDFIQLLPIKKDTPSEVVSMIWQYLKLPEESRKRVTANLIDVDENCEKKDFQVPDLYDIVPKEEIAEFDEELYRKLIKQIVVYKDDSVRVIFPNNNSIKIGYRDL